MFDLQRILKRIEESSGSVNFSFANTLDDGHKLILDEVKFMGMETDGGVYGRVFEVEYEGMLCTVREVDLLQSISIFAQGDDKVLQDSFLNKCHIWSILHHPCIVQFIAVSKNILIVQSLLIYPYGASYTVKL